MNFAIAACFIGLQMPDVNFRNETNIIYKQKENYNKILDKKLVRCWKCILKVFVAGILAGRNLSRGNEDVEDKD